MCTYISNCNYLGCSVSLTGNRAYITTCSTTTVSGTNASFTNLSCALIDVLNNVNLTNLSTTYWATNTSFGAVINGSNASFQNSCFNTASITNLSSINASIMNLSATIMNTINSSIGSHNESISSISLMFWAVINESNTSLQN